MAEQQTATESGSEAAKASGGLMGKLLIAGCLGAVVALECLLAYFLIPDAAEVAALAEKRMAERLPASLSEEELGMDKDATLTVEIPLGDFSVTVSQPNTSTALRVDFELVGTVLEEDKTEVNALFDRHVHRFRDQILYEIRNSDPADLADPGLGLIKRRILEKSNALFGKPILRSVVFSQFSYVEQ